MAPSVSEQREQCGEFPKIWRETENKRTRPRWPAGYAGARQCFARACMRIARCHEVVLTGKQFFESVWNRLTSSGSACSVSIPANRPGQSQYYYLHPTSRLLALESLQYKREFHVGGQGGPLSRIGWWGGRGWS